MKIGLTAGAATLDKIIAQAQQAEADGFHSLWYASGVLGDPLVAMALAGRATSTIELGTAVLQTYPCHPLLQARRAASVVEAMGRPGFTLGVGPSHDAVIEGTYGLAFDHPGRSSEEYVQILTTLLRGEGIEFEGEDWTVRAPEGSVRAAHPVPVLLSALSPRLLRVAGEHADGTVLWMAPRAAIESHVAPRITEAATAAGRPAPRIVAGLPVAVDDDLDAARRGRGRDRGGLREPSHLQADHGRRGGRQRRRGRHRRRRGVGRGAGTVAVRRRGDGSVGLHRPGRPGPPRLRVPHDRTAQQPGPRMKEIDS